MIDFFFVCVCFRKWLLYWIIDMLRPVISEDYHQYSYLCKTRIPLL